MTQLLLWGTLYCQWFGAAGALARSVCRMSREAEMGLEKETTIASGESGEAAMDCHTRGLLSESNEPCWGDAAIDIPGQGKQGWFLI